MREAVGMSSTLVSRLVVTQTQWHWVKKSKRHFLNILKPIFETDGMNNRVDPSSGVCPRQVGRILAALNFFW